MSDVSPSAPPSNRRRYRCPTFRDGISVSPQGGWIDRAKLNFRSSELWGFTNNELLGLLDRIADGDFFRRRNRALQFGGPDWLLCGRIRFRWQSDNGRSFWRLDITLDVNLTRFISLRGLPALIDRLNPNLEQLFRAEDGYADRLRTLDRSDNFIPSTERLGEAQATSWPLQFRCLIDLVSALLEAKLGPHVRVEADPENMSRPPVGRVLYLIWSHWIIKQMETYWEFFSLDALAAVEQFRWQLPRLSSSIRATHYDIEADETEPFTNREIGRETQLHSSLSLSIPLGFEKMHMAIYAKKRNRLRFEVRRNGKVRGSLGEAGTTGRLSDQSMDGLQPFLREVAQDSARRMNCFLRALDTTRPRGLPNARTLAELLIAFSQACGRSEYLFRDLLTELITTGRIAKSNSPRRRNVLRSLRRRGVLEYRCATLGYRSGVYDLSFEYQPLATTLRLALRPTE